MEEKSNEITLSLKIKFTEDAQVTDADKNEIGKNILRAFQSYIMSGNGIAPAQPELSDYVTDEIKLYNDTQSWVLDCASYR